MFARQEKTSPTSMRIWVDGDELSCTDETSKEVAIVIRGLWPEGYLTILLKPTARLQGVKPRGFFKFI